MSQVRSPEWDLIQCQIIRETQSQQLLCIRTSDPSTFRDLNSKPCGCARQPTTGWRDASVSAFSIVRGAKFRHAPTVLGGLRPVLAANRTQCLFCEKSVLTAPPNGPQKASAFCESGCFWSKNKTQKAFCEKNPDSHKRDNGFCMSGSGGSGISSFRRLKVDRHKISENGQISLVIFQRNFVLDINTKILWSNMNTPI